MKKFLAMFVVGTFLLAGCSSGGGGSGGSGDKGGQQVAAAPATSTLVIGNSAELNGLDPHIRLSTFNARVSNQIFQPLFRLSADGKIEGVLATAYKNVDPTTWEFTLREGVTFHDAAPWNAQAFVDNLKRMFDKALPSNVSSGIPTVVPDKTEIVNDHTVRVHTSTPDALLPRRFSHYWLSFVSPKVIDGHDAAYVATHPVGTGPYTFVDWKKDDHLTLKAWSGYWGPKATIDTLTFKPLPDPQSRVSALLAGQIDMAVDVPTPAVAQIDANPGTKIITAPTGTMEYNLYVDARKGGALANPKVRLALNYAIDRESIVKQVMGGMAVPTQSVVTPQSFGYNSDLQPYGYNPDKAKALLKEAGYGDGFTTNLWYVPGASPNEQEVTQTIQGYLAAVGVKVTLKPNEFTTNLSQTLGGKLDGLFYAGKTNQIMDADGIFTDSAPGSPWGQYAPLAGEALTLWKQEQQTFDDAQRAKLAQQIQKLLYDAPNWVYLHQMKQVYAVSSRVQGWQPRQDILLDFAGVTVQSK
ncbi:MAG: extracellular solute-binding protein family 5 [Firmicutes bacterium]|nr:extracellular solute-binding protein family 5 [Bacillota bacterium]